MSRLFPELLDLVFKELDAADGQKKFDQKRSDLRACTLVSKAWSEPARRNLFSQLSYTFRRPRSEHEAPWPERPPSQRWGRSASCRGQAEEPQKTLDMLRDFLKETPAAAARVRVLYLEVYTVDWKELPRECFHIAFSSADHVDPELFVEVLQLLPNLRKLITSNVVLSGAPSLGNRLNLEYLTISHCPKMEHGGWTELSATDVARLLCCFGKVGDLCVTNVTHLPKAKQLQDYPSLSNLEPTALILDSVRTDHAFITHLLESRVVSSLRDLRIQILAFHQWAFYKTIFERVAPQLEKLIIDMPQMESNGAFINISSSTSRPNVTRSRYLRRTGLEHSASYRPWSLHKPQELHPPHQAVRRQYPAQSSSVERFAQHPCPALPHSEPTPAGAYPRRSRCRRECRAVCAVHTELPRIHGRARRSARRACRAVCTTGRRLQVRHDELHQQRRIRYVGSPQQQTI